MGATPAKRVLAIASGGGHWTQLQRVRAAFDDCDVTFATVQPSYAEEVRGHAFRVVPDATRHSPLRVVSLLFVVLGLVARERPDVVVSTGAAPGFFALIFGRLFGARTVWIDSIANAGRISLSGRLVRPFAGLWLTQWKHLARENGPTYRGSVL